MFKVGLTVDVYSHWGRSITINLLGFDFADQWLSSYIVYFRHHAAFQASRTENWAIPVSHVAHLQWIKSVPIVPNNRAPFQDHSGNSSQATQEDVRNQTNSFIQLIVASINERHP